MLFALKIGFEEAALGRRGKIPVADERRRPGRIETPDGKRNALRLKVSGNVLTIRLRRNDRNMRTAFIRQAESDLGANDRIRIRHETEIFLPFLLPGFGTLHRVRMGHIRHIRTRRILFFISDRFGDSRVQT